MEIFQNEKRQDDVDNVAAFRLLMAANPDLTFYHPSPAKAPWHIQCRIEGETDVILNFWPHRAKAQMDGRPSVEGMAAVAALIERARADAAEPPYDVIEDAS